MNGKDQEYFYRVIPMELFVSGQENSSLLDLQILHQGESNSKPNLSSMLRLAGKLTRPLFIPLFSNGSVSECNSNRSSSSGTWGMSVTNWAERLVMRGKLTLGSAKPISSFGIYHDHSKFFTGDIDGNVFSWHC